MKKMKQRNQESQKWAHPVAPLRGLFQGGAVVTVDFY